MPEAGEFEADLLDPAFGAQVDGEHLVGSGGWGDFVHGEAGDVAVGLFAGSGLGDFVGQHVFRVEKIVAGAFQVGSVSQVGVIDAGDVIVVGAVAIDNDHLLAGGVKLLEACDVPAAAKGGLGSGDHEECQLSVHFQFHRFQRRNSSGPGGSGIEGASR